MSTKHYHTDSLDYFPNIVRNGGMEKESNEGEAPKYWEIRGDVERTNIPTYVHTGNYAVKLNYGASIRQDVCEVSPCSQYEFSFFAKYGVNTSLTANSATDTFNYASLMNATIGCSADVVFIDDYMQASEVSLDIVPGSLSPEYCYYRIELPPTPTNITGLVIIFGATKSADTPDIPSFVSLYIDDVSLVGKPIRL